MSPLESIKHVAIEVMAYIGDCWKFRINIAECGPVWEMALLTTLLIGGILILLGVVAIAYNKLTEKLPNSEQITREHKKSGTEITEEEVLSVITDPKLAEKLRKEFEALREARTIEKFR